MLLAILLVTGCSTQPLYRLRSPDGTWEVRTYGGDRAFHTEVERIALRKDGRVIEELLPPLDGPIAIANDGSLYLGRHHGHLQQLREVYVYRDGAATYLGDVPFPGFGYLLDVTGKGQSADLWQEWERQMRSAPRAGSACLGLRLSAKTRKGIFAAEEAVVIDLALHNVGREDVRVPETPLAWVAPRLISFSGNNDLVAPKLDAIRRKATPETPDEKRSRALKPGVALRGALHLGRLPPGEYRMCFGMDQSWRKDELGQSRWQPLPSNEIAFTIHH